MEGYWGGGLGPPRQTYTLGRTKAYTDGAGLPSPGRWAKEDRLFPQGAEWDELRSKLYECLRDSVSSRNGMMIGSAGIQRLMFAPACSPKTEIFEEAWLDEGRRIIGSWLKKHGEGYDDEKNPVAEGQPFYLHMMFFV